MTIPTNVTPRLWSFGNPVQAIVNYYKGRMTREDDQGQEVERSTKGAGGSWKDVPFVWGEGGNGFLITRMTIYNLSQDEFTKNVLVRIFS